MYYKINPGHQLKRGTNCTKVNCDENSFVEGGKISISPITFEDKN